MKSLLARVLAVCLAGCVCGAGFDDEPDELNWDTLGGTLTGFAHFKDYCAGHPDFRARLLKEAPLEPLPAVPESVSLAPAAFAQGALHQWGLADVAGVPCITSYGGHHGLRARAFVDVPADGAYRVWVRYYHEQGSIASFAVEVGDGRLADSADPSLDCVQNVFTHRFDWAEFARKGVPLPNRKDEPTGFIWEASAPVRLARGRHSVTLAGLTHEGPYNSRRVAQVVLSRVPLAAPDAKTPRAPEDRSLWERRPQIHAQNGRLLPLWREWRTQFFADLLAGKVKGIEAGRMAGQVIFDETTNLLGTPRQIQEERAARRTFWQTRDRSHFLCKVEAETFTDAQEGWYREGHSGASGGKILCTGYWGGTCDAYADVTVPSNGVYSVWLRYMEVSGYLAKYHFRVEDGKGNLLGERLLAADDAYNRAHGGFSWVKLDVQVPEKTCRIRLVKKESGLTYRRVDAALVTDDPQYVPSGEGVVVAPFDATKKLTVWRAADPWLGYTHLRAPEAGEDLSPYKVALPEGEAETLLLFVRNNTDQTQKLTPAVVDDPDGLVSWRLPAYMPCGGFGWQPMPLLARRELWVPPYETVGVWVTVANRSGRVKDGITSRPRLRLGADEQAFEIVRTQPLPPSVPVPLVFGWSTPYRQVSCWELYRDLGVNVVCDGLVPKAEAEKYGIRLTVHLNDGNVEPDHVKDLVKRFERNGYTYRDWAWSFMDEPGNGAADQWVALAQKMRAQDPKVRIWVNPGECPGSSPEACLKMLPYVDIYCPYANHYNVGKNNAQYKDLLERKGAKFDTLLGYTTPCFGEKAPSAPLEHLGMSDFGLGCKMDGWAFFALQYGFTYSNSVWDEANCYLADQCVNIYPGAAFRTISTRNAEAIREAVRRYRHGFTARQNSEIKIGEKGR